MVRKMAEKGKKRLRRLPRAERRSAERYACRTRLALESLDAGNSLFAALRNYSREGMYFESNLLMMPGIKIFVGIAQSPYSGDRCSYQCLQVQILWYRELLDSKTRRYGYGARLLNAAEPAPGHGNQPPAAKDGDSPPLQQLRQHPRSDAIRPVVFGTGERFHRGQMKNISQGGMFIETVQRLEIGRPVRLVLPDNRRRSRLIVLGRVVHCEGNGIGVKFVRLLKQK
jgi:hypothetical protein